MLSGSKGERFLALLSGTSRVRAAVGAPESVMCRKACDTFFDSSKLQFAVWICKSSKKNRTILDACYSESLRLPLPFSVFSSVEVCFASTSERISQKFYKANNAYMDIVKSGTKREMHAWQHKMIEGYTYIMGERPPLNKSFYWLEAISWVPFFFQQSRSLQRLKW